MTKISCSSHLFGHRMLGGFPGHEHLHPSGPQVCLQCGKTLEEIVRAAQDEARAEEREASALAAQAVADRCRHFAEVADHPESQRDWEAKAVAVELAVKNIRARGQQ